MRIRGNITVQNVRNIWNPSKQNKKKTIYQDTTENPAPDSISYWDENAHAHEEDEEATEE